MAFLIAPDPAASPESEADVSPPGDQTDVAVPASGTAAQNGADLQAAIDAAATNTRILLDKDGVYEGNFTIDGKTDLWIETVGLDTDPTLPANTTYVTPASGAHLATLRLNGYGEAGFLLWVKKTSTGIRLRGLQCAFVTGSIANGAATTWILVGENDQARNQVPANCHIDRLLCQMPTTKVSTDNVQNFLQFCASDASIRRSYFEAAWAEGVESHCINIDRTTGNVSVLDNYVGSASIGLLVGGGGTWTNVDGTGFVTSLEEVPSGFTFKRNYFRKDTLWHPSIGGAPGFSGNPVVKGGLECKAGNGVVIEGNLFETMYAVGDTNIAATTLAPKCNEVAQSASGSRYMNANGSVIRYNVYFNCPTVMELVSGSDASGGDAPGDEQTDWTPTSGVTVEHNVAYGITMNAPLGISNAVGHFLFVNGIKNLTAQHNTVHYNGPGLFGLFYLDNKGYPSGLNGTPDADLANLLIQNNTFGDLNATYAVQPDYDVSALLAAVAEDPIIRKNYAVDDGYASNWPGGTAGMAAANAGAFFDDFVTAPTADTDKSLLTLGDWTPQATLAGYGTAAGSTGYAHPCANWSLIVSAMGRLYTELMA